MTGIKYKKHYSISNLKVLSKLSNFPDSFWQSFTKSVEQGDNAITMLQIYLNSSTRQTDITGPEGRLQ